MCLRCNLGMKLTGFGKEKRAFKERDEDGSEGGRRQ